MKKIWLSVFLSVAILITGCSKGPGELEGVWRMDGWEPFTVTYRSNEEESMGMISKVEYKHKGNDIIVVYKSGLLEGNAIRLTRIDKNTYRTELGTIRRVK